MLRVHYQSYDSWTPTDLLNIDNPYFEGMVNRIYPPEMQLNKANTSVTEAPFLVLHLSISNGFNSSKIYDKRDDFDFDIVNFPFLDGDVPRSTSYRVYISQLIRFARVSSHVVDFNARNKSLTANLLQQGYRYHKLRPHFDLYQSLNRLPIWNSQNCSMFPLAFVAGWLQGHWWGFISRNYVVWPTFFLMNIFIALKGSHFWFYIRKTFSKFYRRHYELVSKFSVGLKTLLHQGLSDLVYKFKKN